MSNKSQHVSNRFGRIRGTRILELSGPIEVPKGWVLGTIWDLTSVRIVATLDADIDVERILRHDAKMFQK